MSLDRDLRDALRPLAGDPVADAARVLGALPPLEPSPDGDRGGPRGGRPLPWWWLASALLGGMFAGYGIAHLQAPAAGKAFTPAKACSWRRTRGNSRLRRRRRRRTRCTRWRSARSTSSSPARSGRRCAPASGAPTSGPSSRPATAWRASTSTRPTPACVSTAPPSPRSPSTTWCSCKGGCGCRRSNARTPCASTSAPRWCRRKASNWSPNAMPARCRWPCSAAGCRCGRRPRPGAQVRGRDADRDRPVERLRRGRGRSSAGSLTGWMAPMVLQQTDERELRQRLDAMTKAYVEGVHRDAAALELRRLGVHAVPPLFDALDSLIADPELLALDRAADRRPRGLLEGRVAVRDARTRRREDAADRARGDRAGDRDERRGCGVLGHRGGRRAGGCAAALARAGALSQGLRRASPAAVAGLPWRQRARGSTGSCTSK